MRKCTTNAMIPAFYVCNLVRQKSTGTIRECYGVVVSSSYPYLYVFENNMQIAGEDLEKVNGEDCYRCGICNTYHLHSEEPSHVVSGRIYCPSCASERLAVCEQCGAEYDTQRIMILTGMTIIGANVVLIMQQYVVSIAMGGYTEKAHTKLMTLITVMRIVQ